MSALAFQPAVLAPVPQLARYLSFRLRSDADPPTLRACLGRLAGLCNGLDSVAGLGATTLNRLGVQIEGMLESPSFAGALEPISANPRALWLWLRGEDRGELFHRGVALGDALVAAFRLEAVTDGFRYGSGRDLSGYEDGTENPKGEEAAEAAIVSSGGPGFEGASFVAVQHWVHDLRCFAGYSASEQDHIIGRRRADNEELDDAPLSAHVKRTAQESFSPEAFMVRRSMPWLDGESSGLEFVAFGCSFYAFEAQMRRMLGLEDGIVDGLFRFSRPLTTSYYWCPPLQGRQLDLRALRL